MIEISSLNSLLLTQLEITSVKAALIHISVLTMDLMTMHNMKDVTYCTTKQDRLITVSLSSTALNIFLHLSVNLFSFMARSFTVLFYPHRSRQPCFLAAVPSPEKPTVE